VRPGKGEALHDEKKNNRSGVALRSLRRKTVGEKKKRIGKKKGKLPCPLLAKGETLDRKRRERNWFSHV